jgi:hypothetical protein
MTHIGVLSTTAFYLDPFRGLILAMVRAEGGQAAMVKAVQCSRPDVTTFSAALAIACKTIRNRVIDYQERGIGPLFVLVHHTRSDPWTMEAAPRRLAVSETFIRFLAARWAPIGVANDPTNLNSNWAGNVIAIYREILDATEPERLQEV